MKSKLIIILVLLMSIAGFVNAQPAERAQKSTERTEKMPQFVGGDNAFYAYLDENVSLPDGFDAAGYLKENGNQYVPVSVVFTIDVDGSITKVHVLEQGNALLDDKAVEIVKNMPKWQPGVKNGNPIKVQFAIPIRFNLKG